LLSIKSNCNNSSIRYFNLWWFNPDCCVISFINWFNFISCKSHSFVTSSLLIETFTIYCDNCSTIDRSNIRNNSW
jgi:hypothetical protein